MSAARKATAKTAPCPICGKPAVPSLAPFCSERCADIDLGRWLSDRYVIPGEDDGEPSLSEPESDPTKKS
ncbi:DNA gyrase inhibitor YacG [Methylobacterium symbioticum]|uniref:DNA gyrase inhibitor YacG n=1 Tax=Methylobacterium symbioticum TaxID=2584084 RepID=A0A509E930_9HYPH|nr:DNA gyrase inhibitor YacG [Methylobacterium symbioticum]VUD69693.1 DNA gyrase inhibitor YacG [Methylobacterium symbioticum]